MQLTEVQRSVLETEGEIGSIPAEEVGKALHPVVRLVSVQGLVVEGGHHLGHRLLGFGSGNHGRPSLLYTRFQLGGEALPFYGKVLVRPRDVDLPSRQIGPVFSNVSDVNGESATHGLGHLLLDACLCCPFVRPKGLQGLSSMDDLHECPSAPVARAPHGLERIARLDRPGGSGDVIGNLYGESLRFRIHHQNGQQSLDLLAEAVLGLKNGPIGALLQLEGKFLVPSASVVKPCVATTSPNSHELVLERSGSGLWSLPIPPP